MYVALQEEIVEGKYDYFQVPLDEEYIQDISSVYFNQENNLIAPDAFEMPVILDKDVREILLKERVKDLKKHLQGINLSIFFRLKILKDLKEERRLEKKERQRLQGERQKIERLAALERARELQAERQECKTCFYYSAFDVCNCEGDGRRYAYDWEKFEKRNLI